MHARLKKNEIISGPTFLTVFSPILPLEEKKPKKFRRKILCDNQPQLGLSSMLPPDAFLHINKVLLLSVPR